VSVSTPAFYKICWHLCISTPRERTRHTHELERRLLLGLLFFENWDFSQLKKPPFAFNSNSTGKWSLTPSACKTTAQRDWEPAAHALPKPCPRGFTAAVGRWVCSGGGGEAQCEHCIALGGCSPFMDKAMFKTAWIPLALCSCVSPCPAAAEAMLCLPAPRSSEIPAGSQRCWQSVAQWPGRASAHWPQSCKEQGTGCCYGVPDQRQPCCTKLVAREVALMRSYLSTVCPSPWAAYLEMPARAFCWVGLIAFLGSETPKYLGVYWPWKPMLNDLYLNPPQQCCKVQSHTLDTKIIGHGWLESQWSPDLIQKLVLQEV